METPLAQPAANLAERIVRHFQREGFLGISEALVLRIRLRQGDPVRVKAAFAAAQDSAKAPPVHDWFELHAVDHFSDFRSFAEAKAAIPRDFTPRLRHGLPATFFEPAPVLIDDPLATDTKYDALIKLANASEGEAYAVLLNDPDASFLDYLARDHLTNWEEFMGDFTTTAIAFCLDDDLA